ncbi:glycosyltransferase [Caballeronia sp. S22]|uniref:glycosyltransferase n=1 Tax=Caballeronia sp. S22 TaxID=3137182 RepID=UPI00353170ED
MVKNAMIQCKYGYFQPVPEDDEQSEALRHYGEWAERRFALMRKFVRVGSVVVEAGASIGAHSVAYARLTRGAGHVHAFEPDALKRAALRANVEHNHLADIVTVHEYADGTDATHADPVIVSLLPTADLLVLDDASAAARLRGAMFAVPGAHRPVIVATGAAAAAVLDARPALSDYLAFGCADYLFNPDNYRRSTINVYGDRAQAMLLLLPAERADAFDLRDLQRVDTAHHLQSLSHEKTSMSGSVSVKPGAAVDAGLAAGQPAEGPRASLREALVAPDADPVAAVGTPCIADAVHVVVPFYKKEELVAQVFQSLKRLSSELRELGAKVFFYNDSPDYAPLRAALSACRFDDGEVELTIVENPSNLGFIGTCNRAFADAKAAHADIILLNSDTVVFPGALSEMIQVARLDTMFGFVSPRSNNATLATLPHSSLDGDVPMHDGYADFVRCSSMLPRFSYVPTAVGFCLLIKWAVFSELGFFDPVFGTGYNEENDLVMRGSRCGYRAVLANHAFVWHQGEQSFAQSARAKEAREAKNAPILQSRYPEYLPMIHRYFSSPEYRAEVLLEYVEPRNGSLTFAFDFSTFGPFFNGTFESGIRLLEAAVRCWPKHCRIAVYMDAVAWKFHQLDKLGNVERLDVHDGNAKVSAIVRVGQPFDTHSVTRLIERAPVVGIFMLDTISYDCGYLSLTFDHNIWRYVFGHIDVLFTNSRYTLERISSRFRLGSRVLRRVSRHSLDVTEYAQPAAHAAGVAPHIFIIGNHFSHKFVRQTADAVASAFPDRTIMAVGYGEGAPAHANVKCAESGNLSNEVFERFYVDAEAVIFPSHYEGFGFPILHALARERPIFVRDSALYRELAPAIKGADNIRYYCTTDELIDDLQRSDPGWKAPAAPGERGGWDRSAREVFNALEQARATVSYDALVERMRALDQLSMASTAAFVPPTASKRVGAVVERVVDRVLAVPGVRPAAHQGRRLVRRLRRRR